MALADITDVQTYLPTDRIPTNSSDITGYQLSVERIVKGYLVGIFTASTMAAWTTPTTTPQIIREVAARMIAGYRYRDRTSEETPGGIEETTYGQRLYNEAVAMLNDIRSGSLDVIDVNGTDVIDTSSTSEIAGFPDNTTTPTFSMGATF
jgi:hypothetical protein